MWHLLNSPKRCEWQLDCLFHYIWYRCPSFCSFHIYLRKCHFGRVTFVTNRLQIVMRSSLKKNMIARLIICCLTQGFSFVKRKAALPSSRETRTVIKRANNHEVTDWGSKFGSSCTVWSSVQITESNSCISSMTSCSEGGIIWQW